MNDDDEVGLPQKGLNIIIKDILPDLRIANESRELLNQCCVEFIKHISREAQRISFCDQRKTIYHDHIQKALLNLGFPSDYVQAANSVLDECKIAAEKRLKRKKSRLDKCGIPEEELYLMQQELIEKARKEEAEKIQKEQFLYVQNFSQVYGIGTSNIPTTNLFEQQNTTTINQLNNESQIINANTLHQLNNTNNLIAQNLTTINNSSLLTDKSDCENAKINESADKLASTETTADETPIMTNEMKAVLAANFIASIQSCAHEDDSEDFD